MTIGAHIQTLYSLPVCKFDPQKGLTNPEAYAWRVGAIYDGPETCSQILEQLLQAKGADKIRALVIGPWFSDDPSTDSSDVAASLIKGAPILKNLSALFFGDITFEECEISWLTQSDLGPVIMAYPKLVDFTCRGGTELRLTGIKHDNLKSLCIQTGGLPQVVVEDIFESNLPNIERLELWIGSDGYGCDLSSESLEPLLSGSIFPKLTHLGLRNAEDADGVANYLQGAKILDRITSLDLSMGALTDEGGEALLANPGIKKLKTLNLCHHYFTSKLQKRLQALNISIDLSQALDPEEEYKSAEVTE